MFTFIIFALVGVIITSMIVCFKKGKGRTAVLGFLFFWPAIVIGAVRIAKPGSPFFGRYGDEKRTLALQRFPKEAAGILLLEQRLALTQEMELA
jgi:hypothetical protein